MSRGESSRNKREERARKRGIRENAHLLVASIKNALLSGTKHFTKDGKPLETAEEILDALTRDGEITFAPKGEPQAKGLEADDGSPVNAVQVAQVTAMWRDDEPGGIALSIPYPPDKPGAGLGFARKLYAKVRELDVKAHSIGVQRAVVEALDWLRIFAIKHSVRRCGDEIGSASDTTSEVFQAFMLIEWLESRRHIKSDDHNGVAWLVLDSANRLVIISRSPPTPGVLEELKQRSGGFEQRSVDTDRFEREVTDLLTGDAKEDPQGEPTP